MSRTTRWLGLLLAGSAVLAQAPVLRLTAPKLAPGPDPVVLTSEIDLAAVATIYGPGTKLDPDRAVAVVQADGKDVPLVTQLDTLPEGQTTISIALPREYAGRTIRLLLAPTVQPVPVEPGLEVTKEGGALTVHNTHYEVTHDPAKLGGLPSTMVLLPSGKVFDSYTLGDRLYDKPVGGWDLRRDTQPKVSVVANGPLRTVVRVEARYLQDAKAAPSNPRACYDFSYYPGSPRVDLTVKVTQDTPYAWGQLHVMEINFPDESFPGWLGGDPVETAQFVAEKKATHKAWGALVDGDSTVGLLGSNVLFYDGRHDYGTYLHGPWVPWDSLSKRFDLTLYLSGQPASAEAFTAAAHESAGRYHAVALPEKLLSTLDGVRAAAQGQPAALRQRLGWWSALATARASQGRLADGWRLAQALAAEAVKLAPEPAKLDAWFEARTGCIGLVGNQLAAAFRGPKLVSLYDLERHRELLATAAPLWRLQLRDADLKLHEFGPDSWVGLAGEDLAQLDRLPGHPAFKLERQDGLAVKLTFHGFPVPAADNAVGPDVTFTVRLEGALMQTNLAVDNNTPFSLWHSITPYASLAPVSSEPADETLFLPIAPGKIYRGPLATGVNRRGTYPQGWWTMPYVAFYGPGGGTWFAALDPDASIRDYEANADAASGAVNLTVDWPMPDMSLPGNDWRQPGYGALGAFGGDWYDAAMVYRDWVEQSANWWPAKHGKRQTPKLFSDISIWALASGGPEAVVDPTIKFAEYMGVPTALHWYSWHEIPFDDHYPHYNPTKPGMKEGTAKLQAAGVKVMPYINARLWDSRLDDFKDEAIKSACLKEDGTPYLETYGSKVPLAPMDPSTTFWQDKVREIVLWIQNDLGTDGVYLDQVAAARPVLCFNREHGHPLGGGCWWTVDGYWPMLERMRAAMGPSKFITTECNAEPYLQYFDGYLTWHWQEQDMVPAFSAVYADQVALFSRAYRGGQTRDLADRMKAAQSLCFGEQLGWLNPDVVNRASGPFLRTCAQLRYQLADYLAHGRMLRPPTVTNQLPVLTADWAWRNEWPISLPAVQTAAWRAKDGRIVLLFANFTTAEQSVTFKFDPAEYGLGAGQVTMVKRTASSAEAPTKVPAAWAPTVTIPAEQVIAYELTP